MTKGHALDTCYCGDYRRDHKGGVGACNFNPDRGDRDGHFGAGRCDAFRLAKLYVPPEPRPTGEAK